MKRKGRQWGDKTKQFQVGRTSVSDSLLCLPANHCVIFPREDFRKARKISILHSPEATCTPQGRSSRFGLHLLSPSPLPHWKGLGAKRRSGSSAASEHMPQSSRPQRNAVAWEALRYLQLRTTSALPSHPLPTLRVLWRKELSQKRVFIFMKSLKCFFFLLAAVHTGSTAAFLCVASHCRLLFSAGWLGVLASVCEDVPSNRWEAMAAWWDMLFLTMSPFRQSTTSCSNTASRACQGLWDLLLAPPRPKGWTKLPGEQLAPSENSAHAGTFHPQPCTWDHLQWQAEASHCSLPENLGRALLPGIWAHRSNHWTSRAALSYCRRLPHWNS